MKGALEMQELNYVAFENEFVKFCSGDIDTELEYGGKVKPCLLYTSSKVRNALRIQLMRYLAFVPDTPMRIVA